MQKLFPQSFIHTVCRLRIATRGASPAGRRGEHMSRRAGSGVEFRDYRTYAPGDDLRRVDWNIYRRSRRLYLRLAEEPRELPVYILLDASDSMFFEDPPRVDAARRVAAALAAAAVHQHDRAAVYPMGAELGRPLPLASGQGFAGLLTRLAELRPRGQTNLVAALRSFAALRPARGLLAVVSDFFDPAGADAVLAELGKMQHRLALVQLVRQTDREPPLAGDLELLDCETGVSVLTTATPADLSTYRAAYQACLTSLHNFATRHGAIRVEVDCDAPMLSQLDRLFPGGILRV